MSKKNAKETAGELFLGFSRIIEKNKFINFFKFQIFLEITKI